MLKKLLLGIAFALAATILPGQAKADPIRFISILTGSQETPPNSSLALGYGTLVLNDAHTAAIISLQWAGLSSNLTAAHVHLGAPGVNGTRLLAFASSGGTSGLLT
ncbi:MAG: CHRD domain-containing protein, partial [Pyrinomonadaceae bacterium]